MTDKPYITLPEWAERQGISNQAAHEYYAAGRLPGAYSSGRAGVRPAILLPAGTPKPAPLPTGAAAHRGRQ